MVHNEQGQWVQLHRSTVSRGDMRIRRRTDVCISGWHPSNGTAYEHAYKINRNQEVHHFVSSSSTQKLHIVRTRDPTLLTNAADAKPSLKTSKFTVYINSSISLLPAVLPPSGACMDTFQWHKPQFAAFIWPHSLSSSLIHLGFGWQPRPNNKSINSRIQQYALHYIHTSKRSIRLSQGYIPYYSKLLPLCRSTALKGGSSGQDGTQSAVPRGRTRLWTTPRYCPECGSTWLWHPTPELSCC